MTRIVCAVGTVAAMLVLGCNRIGNSASVSFEGHRLGESYAQFASVEHSASDGPPGLPYTGTIHCFETKDLGAHCKGQRYLFDNAHFTFVNDKLSSIDAVGAGGIIGDKHQNWNWNLYLAELTKQYGKPNKMTATDAVWSRGSSVVHAYLTIEPMMFNPSEESQTEHVEVVSNDASLSSK
jgi:hypothetical protein